MMKNLDCSSIENILKRIGFFHIQIVDQGTELEFRAGHIPDALFSVLIWNKSTGVLSGPYADFVDRLASVISRYFAESDEMIMLPVAARQAWIADLASQAGLTTDELQRLTAGT